jgi:multidrug efflux system membrane fusion protein
MDPNRMRSPSSIGLHLRSLLFASLAAFTACSQSPPSRPDPRVPVSVARAVRKAVPEVVTAVGSVEAIDSIAVKSQVDGELLEAHVRDGENVTQGQLLFRIDPRPARAALAQAEAALAKDTAARDLARAQVDRYKPIAAQHYISADQMQQYLAALEAAAAGVRVDEANVAAGKLELGYTDIHAPIAGRAGRILVQPGNLVKANDVQPLLTINRIAPIFVNFAIPGSDVDRVRAAQARGTLAARAAGDGIDGGVAGTLSFVDNAVDPATNTVKLRARFPNADEKLWPGQFVNVSLTLGNDADAIAVPDAAVKAGPNGDFVFVIENGAARQRDVSVARSIGGVSVIASGVAAGEIVVTDGQSRLVDGAPVKMTGSDQAAADAVEAAR